MRVGRRYRLERAQKIPRPREDVFTFFTAAENLEAITPDFLRFRILTPTPIQIHVGTLINYRLHLLAIPFYWRTYIEAFEPPYYFTDVQLAGPYRYWHHTHEFFAVNDGTLVVDSVDYELPFGLLGTVAQELFVRRYLERIFDYRRECLQALFPPLETTRESTYGRSRGASD